jgi:hypothetical protein
MEADALITMIIGMIIIWGGLAASIVHAVRLSRRRQTHVDEPADEPTA